MSKNTIIIFIVILIVGFFGYSYFFVSKDDNSTALKDVALTASSTDATGVANTLSQNDQYLKQLIALKGIDLKLDLFKDDAYKILHLYNNEIIPEPRGRENPFAPVEQGAGKYGAGIINSTSFQITSTSSATSATSSASVPGLSGKVLTASSTKKTSK